jgi:hypothetical protein
VYAEHCPQIIVWYAFAVMPFWNLTTWLDEQEVQLLNDIRHLYFHECWILQFLYFEFRALQFTGCCRGWLLLSQAYYYCIVCKRAHLMNELEACMLTQSWVNRENSRGLSTHPCGAPVLRISEVEVLFPTFTTWGQPVSKSRTQLHRAGFRPRVMSLEGTIVDGEL